MQVTWAMQVDRNHNTKKWPWLLTTFIVYFKDVHVKWCQKHQRQAYTCKWWRHVNWWVYGGLLRKRRVPLFCLLSTFHKYSKGISGITWPFMLFSCIPFLAVCGCRTRERGQSCQQCLSPFKTRPTDTLACSDRLPNKKGIRWRGRHQATSVFLNTGLAWMVWSGGGGGCSDWKTLFRDNNHAREQARLAVAVQFSYQFYQKALHYPLE